MCSSCTTLPYNNRNRKDLDSNLTTKANPLIFLFAEKLVINDALLHGHVIGK